MNGMNMISIYVIGQEIIKVIPLMITIAITISCVSSIFEILSNQQC